MLSVPSKGMLYDPEFYNLTFRQFLEENHVCFVQNRDRDPKEFMGVQLTPFEFLVVSQVKNANYIIEIIGTPLPNERGSCQVTGRINTGESRRIELEHAIFWQNMFKSFTSYLVFLYVFRTEEAIEEFKKCLPNVGRIFKHATKGIEQTFGIAAIPSNEYLVYVNTKKIPYDDIHIKPKDLPNIFRDVSTLIPDLKFDL